MAEDIGFEEQLQQEELEKKRKEESELRTRRDPDGTEYEWDPEKKAWFPKIDEDFIAKYNLSYGTTEAKTGSVDSNPQTETNDKKVEADSTQLTDTAAEEYWRNYYQYYDPKASLEQQWQEYYAYCQRYQKEGQPSDEEKDPTKYDTSVKSDENRQEGSDSQQGETSSAESQYYEFYGIDYSQYNQDYYNYYEGQPPEEGQVESEAKDDSQDSSGKKKKKEKKAFAKRQHALPQKSAEGWFDVGEQKNTNVYVSGLPFDISDEEFEELMAKYGLIMFDHMTKKPKVKLYRDENGDPKGDGRCCFIKVESVHLALKLLDGSDYKGHKVSVEQAKFQMKGEFDPSKKRKKLSNKQKNKLREKQKKLFDWRPEPFGDVRQKHEKVVILKNMFDPKDFEDDPKLINELNEDVRVECSKFGDVKKVVTFDRNPDGVMSVTFKEAEEADGCIEALHQRWFAKRRILAQTWDGKAKFEIEETQAEREARLKKWEQFLTTSASTTDLTVEAGENSAVPGESVTENSTPVSTSADVVTMDVDEKLVNQEVDEKIVNQEVDEKIVNQEVDEKIVNQEVASEAVNSKNETQDPDAAPT